jgi:hypothetical protein
VQRVCSEKGLPSPNSVRCVADAEGEWVRMVGRKLWLGLFWQLLEGERPLVSTWLRDSTFWKLLEHVRPCWVAWPAGLQLQRGPVGGKGTGGEKASTSHHAAVSATPVLTLD